MPHTNEYAEYLLTELRFAEDQLHRVAYLAGCYGHMADLNGDPELRALVDDLRDTVHANNATDLGRAPRCEGSHE